MSGVAYFDTVMLTHVLQAPLFLAEMIESTMPSMVHQLLKGPTSTRTSQHCMHLLHERLNCHISKKLSGSRIRLPT